MREYDHSDMTWRHVTVYMHELETIWTKQRVETHSISTIWFSSRTWWHRSHFQSELCGNVSYGSSFVAKNSLPQTQSPAGTDSFPHWGHADLQCNLLTCIYPFEDPRVDHLLYFTIIHQARTTPELMNPSLAETNAHPVISDQHRNGVRHTIFDVVVFSMHEANRTLNTAESSN